MGGLGTTYDVHLGLIGKRVVDFLLALIELFSLRVTAESLRAKIDRKSAICIQVGHHPPNFIADSFHTKKLCSRLSSSEVRFYTVNGRFTFLSPLEGLGATYDDHLRLIGKRVVDFLLVSIELFSLGVTAEALRACIGSKSAISLQRGLLDPKFQIEVVAPSPTIVLLRKLYKLNDLSHGIKIWTDLSSILSQSTLLADGQTGRTDTHHSHR